MRGMEPPGEVVAGSTNATSTASSLGTKQPARLACDVCRERKVRCDRGEPKCGRCTRLDYDCGYQGRKRYRSAQVDMARKVAELQNRLDHTEMMLRGQTISETHIPGPAVANPAIDFNSLDWPSTLDLRLPDLDDHSHIDQGMIDFLSVPIQAQAIPDMSTLIPRGLLSLSTEELSHEELDELHRQYFDVFYHIMPIVSKIRFFDERQKEPASPALQSLSYAIALIGAMISPPHAHLQATCYLKARAYIELCERDELDECTSISRPPSLLQALIFTVRYEITKKQLRRAALTLGKAVTLAELLGMDMIDSQGDGDMGAMKWPSMDAPGVEEMRRSYWALYVFDSYFSTRTDRPLQLRREEPRVFLPSPVSLDDFSTIHMPFLVEPAYLSDIPRTSSYLGIVIMVKFLRRCLTHVNISSRDAGDTGFWDRHYALIRTIADLSSLLQEYLLPEAALQDALAFTLQVNLAGTAILIHETAIGKAEESRLPSSVAAESKEVLHSHGLEIARRCHAVATESKGIDMISIQAVFLGWPIAMAIRSLRRNMTDCSEGVRLESISSSLASLQNCLDRVEEADGHWHKYSRAPLTAFESPNL